MNTRSLKPGPWARMPSCLLPPCFPLRQVLHLARFARSLELQVLLEVHGRPELDRLCEFVDMVGVNNRDLKTFEVDMEVSLELA